MLPHRIKISQVKHKEKNLKAARDKQKLCTRKTPQKLTGDCLAETLQNRREWHDIFKVLKGKKKRHYNQYSPQLCYNVIIQN